MFKKERLQKFFIRKYHTVSGIRANQSGYFLLLLIYETSKINVI